MANFRTHVTFSSMLGCGYAAAGYTMGVPIETALVGGGLCGLSGMLPDLDSDSGIPLRESMAFAAAIVPALLLERLRALGRPHDEMVLMAAGLYFFVRFGVTKLIAGRTSHRGMFHSIPAALIFAGIAFLICFGTDVNMRYFKAGGVFIGVMSHLVLDEIYSFEVKRGRLKVKRSFGTALKFWSKDWYSNFSTYTKLAIIVVLILGEPAVMEQLDAESPSIATTIRQIQERFNAWRQGTVEPLVETRGEGIGQQVHELGGHVGERLENYAEGARRYATQFGNEPGGATLPADQNDGGTAPADGFFQPGANFFENAPPQPPGDGRLYDAARGGNGRSAEQRR